jgi:hypothetical protein
MISYIYILWYVRMLSKSSPAITCSICFAAFFVRIGTQEKSMSVFQHHTKISFHFGPFIASHSYRILSPRALETPSPDHTSAVQLEHLPQNMARLVGDPLGFPILGYPSPDEAAPESSHWGLCPGNVHIPKSQLGDLGT